MLYTEEDTRMSEFQRENRRRTRRYVIVFACLFFVLLLIFYANVSVGTVALRADLVSQTILWRIRLPRDFLAHSDNSFADTLPLSCSKVHKQNKYPFLFTIF